MIHTALAKLDLILPKAPTSLASYIPYRLHNGVLYIAGQLPVENGTLVAAGKAGQDRTLEEATHAARVCALNILSQVESALEGKWDRLEACLMVWGFVNAIDTYTQHPQVINGASDLLEAVLGDKGRHARAAVGVASLPLGATVEVAAQFAIKTV